MPYTYLNGSDEEVGLRPLDGVRELRERRMLTQQELADRAGVSLFTVQRIERGEGSVRPTTGRAIAGALGVGVEDLLGKVQAPQPSLEDAARSEALQGALAALFRNLAHRGQRIIEQSLKEGPSEALTRELTEYQKEVKEAAKLYKIKGGPSIFGHDSEELAEAEEAYQEVEGRIQAMLRQDVEATDRERRDARRFKSKGESYKIEERQADVS